jgi:hypothetical protein
VAVIDEGKGQAGRTMTRRCIFRSARRQIPAALIAAALLAGTAAAQPEYGGHFEVRSGADERRSGVWYVDAIIDLRLSSQATEALHAGLPLTIIIEAEILHRLRLWWDSIEAAVSRRTQLTYHAVTDRYLVRNINTGERDSFTTLAGALAFMGRVDDLPVVDAALLNESRRYAVRVRAVLDTDELPGPLRLIAFWRNDWSIDSEWLQWNLDVE